MTIVSVHWILSRANKLSKTTALFSDRTEQRHTFALKKTSTNQPEKRTYTCQVCNSHPGHLLIHCPLFREKTPTERYQIIKDLKRCFNCFSAHMASECTNPKKNVQSVVQDTIPYFISVTTSRLSLLHISQWPRRLPETPMSQFC